MHGPIERHRATPRASLAATVAGCAGPTLTVINHARFGFGVANHNTTNGTGGDVPIDPGPGLGVIQETLDWLVAPEHQLAVRVFGTVFVVAAMFVLSRVIRLGLERSARRTAERNNFDDWQTRAIVSRTKPFTIVFRIGISVSGFIFILALWGLQSGFVSLLTAAGVAGIVIGMAASNSLSNLIAGFLIFYNHPFDIGDWVEIDGTEGIIIDVKAGATVLETWDGEKVTFPNRMVEGTKVRNLSHQRKLRRRFAIGVDYSTDIAKARGLLLKLISAHPEVLKDPEPMVVGMSFGDSSINLELRYWVLPLRARTLLIQTWLMQEVQRCFAQEGIVIPYPQRTLVHRFPGAEPPEGETVSRLRYDPDTDTVPIPGPPLDPPLDHGSTYQKQQGSPGGWLRKRRRNGGGPVQGEETV